MIKIALLGSTGSIGKQVLNVVDRYPNTFKILTMAAGSNAAIFSEQINKYKPQIACLSNPEKVGEIKSIPSGTSFYYGENALIHAVIKECDIVVVAVMGYAGLNAVKLAIEMGKNVALANKETLVTAGHIIMPLAKEKGVKIAVYNCRWENFVVEPKVWEVILSALPDLGIKYDISHCIYHDGNYLAEMRDWGDRFYHFHLKGCVYFDNDVYDDAPAGLDSINWGAAMDILYTKNYDGMLSIEPHSQYWQGKKGQWGIDYTINYFRPMIMPEDYEYEANPYMP